jgi:hypothetical protein
MQLLADDIEQMGVYQAGSQMVGDIFEDLSTEKLVTGSGRVGSPDILTFHY